MRRNVLNFVIVALIAVCVSACSGGSVKKSLGLSKSAPDEFMVVSKPPLSVPPDFSLPTPADAKAANYNKASDAAKATLFNTSERKGSYPKGASKGELALLEQAGTAEANPNIKTILNEEELAKQVVEEEKGMFDAIRDTLNPAKDDPTVNVDKEEDRLTQNAKEGKPVNEGEVPTNSDGKKGLINRILNN